LSRVTGRSVAMLFFVFEFISTRRIAAPGAAFNGTATGPS